jgi:hypothetical protein
MSRADGSTPPFGVLLRSWYPVLGGSELDDHTKSAHMVWKLAKAITQRIPLRRSIPGVGTNAGRRGLWPSSLVGTFPDNVLSFCNN